MLLQGFAGYRTDSSKCYLAQQLCLIAQHLEQIGHSGGAGEGHYARAAFLEGSQQLVLVLAISHSFIGGHHIHLGADFAQGLGQHLASDLGTSDENLVASSDFVGQSLSQFLSLVGRGDEVGSEAVRLQGIGSSTADGSQLYASQSTCVLACKVQALEEIFYAVSASKYQPFIAGQLGNTLVQRAIIGSGHDFNCRNFDNLSTQCFQLFGQIAGLSTGSGHDNGLTKEGLIIEPLQLLTQLHNLAYEENCRGLQIIGLYIRSSLAQGGNQGALLRMGTPANNSSGAISTAAVSNELAGNLFNIFHAHQEHQSVNSSSQSLPVDGRSSLGRVLMAGDNSKGGSHMAMGNGNTGIFGNSDSAGHAGYKFKGLACFQKLYCFLATAAKNEGVAALQTSYGFALLS